MAGVLQHLIRSANAVFHAVKPHIQKILIQRFIQSGSLFNHSGQLKDHFFPVDV
jgi:hypothetical protein